MASSRVPIARGLPLVGNALSMARDIRDFLTAQYLALGPVFRVRMLHRRFTVLAGVEANRFMIRDGIRHLRTFEFWAGFNARFGAGRSLVSSDGPEHAALRRMMRRGYSRQYATDRVAALADLARREIADWPLETPHAVREALQRIATDQVGTLVGGVSPLPYFDDVVYFFRALVGNQVIPNPAIWSRRFRRASKRVHELYLKVMAEHTGDKRRRNAEDGDLIDDFLDVHESDPQFLPEADLKIAALGPFVAALDTVPSTCSFMLYALLKHPQVLAQVQSEADGLFADGGPMLEGLREMDATHRTAMETMRMYPVAAAAFPHRDQHVRARRVSHPGGRGRHHRHHGAPTICRNASPNRSASTSTATPRNAPSTGGRRSTRRSDWAPIAASATASPRSRSPVTMATLLYEVELALAPADYTLKTTQVPLPSPDKSFKVRVVRRRGAGLRQDQGDSSAIMPPHGPPPSRGSRRFQPSRNHRENDRCLSATSPSGPTRTRTPATSAPPASPSWTSR